MGVGGMANIVVMATKLKKWLKCFFPSPPPLVCFTPALEIDLTFFPPTWKKHKLLIFLAHVGSPLAIFASHLKERTKNKKVSSSCTFSPSL